MKELILIKEAKSGGMKFDQKYILKGTKKFSHGFQNFIFQSKHFANILLLKDNSKLCIKLKGTLMQI